MYKGILTHIGLMMPYINIVSVNGLLSDNTEPLPEPMPTNCQRPAGTSSRDVIIKALFSVEENSIENVFCRMSSILLKLQCVTYR